MRKLTRYECTAVNCKNEAAVKINSDLLCTQCAKHEIDPDHARMLINLEMSKHQYSLWFLCSMKVLFKCPVGSFDDARLLYHSLITNSVTGVRIARHDPIEGCEAVLYKFS